MGHCGWETIGNLPGPGAQCGGSLVCVTGVAHPLLQHPQQQAEALILPQPWRQLLLPVALGLLQQLLEFLQHRDLLSQLAVPGPGRLQVQLKVQ